MEASVVAHMTTDKQRTEGGLQGTDYMGLCGPQAAAKLSAWLRSGVS